VKFKVFPWPDGLGWSFLASIAICVAFIVAAIVRRDPLLVLIPAPYLLMCATSMKRVAS
jgi:hypothetical protein